MPFEWLLIGGVLLGSLSPLLTFARLFQMKEWRLDRLSEHLRREGWFASLLGSVNGGLILFYSAGAIVVSSFMAGIGSKGEGLGSPLGTVFAGTILLWLALFIVVGLIKALLRSQRMPVWTSKAMLLVATALVLDCAIAYALTTESLLALPYVVVLQPLVLLVAWLLWKPVDFVVKQRVLSRGTARRASFIDATVIGIVGSVGKTTTKELLKCVLADLSPFTTPEHVNTELGVATWLTNTVPAKAQKPLLIVEMGAYRKGEIALLSRIAQPTIAVVTALGSDHLALFGSEEAIVDANAEILDALPNEGHVFLLGDNASTKGLKKRTTKPVTIAGSADATEIRDTDRGLTLESQGSRFTVALHGQHNAGNALLAIAVARHLGVKDERIRELLAGFRGSAHTFHLKKERGVLILDDTYNVSPLSFRAALDWAKGRSERPRVLLTSGLLETGSAEKDFLEVLGAAAKKSIERAVFTTDSGITAFAEAFGKPVERLASAEKVPDDALLLCVGRMPLAAIQKLLP